MQSAYFKAALAAAHHLIEQTCLDVAWNDQWAKADGSQAFNDVVALRQMLDEAQGYLFKAANAAEAQINAAEVG